MESWARNPMRREQDFPGDFHHFLPMLRPESWCCENCPSLDILARPLPLLNNPGPNWWETSDYLCFFNLKKYIYIYVNIVHDLDKSSDFRSHFQTGTLWSDTGNKAVGAWGCSKPTLLCSGTHQLKCQGTNATQTRRPLENGALVIWSMLCSYLFKNEASTFGGKIIHRREKE